MTISTARAGMVITASAAVRMTASTQPPMKPAVKPRVTPTTMPTNAAMKPIAMERGVPVMIAARMSRPLLSVPSGWAICGAAKPLVAAKIGGRFKGELPTRARVVFQSRGPSTPTRITPNTIAEPINSLGFSQGESQRFKRAALRGKGCATAVVLIYSLSSASGR